MRPRELFKSFDMPLECLQEAISVLDGNQLGAPVINQSTRFTGGLTTYSPIDREPPRGGTQERTA
jgi:hypothetical protein